MLRNFSHIIILFSLVVCISSAFSFHSMFKKFFKTKELSDGIFDLNNGNESSSIPISTHPVSDLNLSNERLDDEKFNSSESDAVRDVVIIGSGPSGCTAAIYAARALLKPLVIAGYQAGGQLMLTNDVENFPGYKHAVTGPEMMSDLTSQAQHFGAEFWMTNCEYINSSTYPFQIRLPNGTLQAKSVIIATGAESIWLNASREDEFKGRGISTCATCDGFIFRNRSVVVIGGGDSAMEEATFLTRFARSVIIIQRSSSFRASKLMIKRAMDNEKITMLMNTTVTSWLGENMTLSGAILQNENGTTFSIDCDGAFIAIGHKPMTKFLDGQLQLDGGYVALERHTMTSIPGIFACGDCVDRRYKQAITAAGSGCQAAIDAERWLEEQHQMK